MIFRSNKKLFGTLRVNYEPQNNSGNTLEPQRTITYSKEILGYHKYAFNLFLKLRLHMEMNTGKI